MPAGAAAPSPATAGYVSPLDYGARCDGVADDAKPLQAAIDAAAAREARGRVAGVRVPGKCRSSVTLQFSAPLSFAGEGCAYAADLGHGVVAEKWASVAGSAIVFTDPARAGLVYTSRHPGFRAPSFRDLCLIGPGRGSQVGLRLGDPADGPARRGTYQAYLSNVFIGNFGVGLELYAVQQGFFSGVRLRANGTNLKFGDNYANANTFVGVDNLYASSVGIYDHVGTVGNTFVGLNIGSNVTASVSAAGCQGTTFDSDYWEDNSGRGIDIDLTNCSGVSIANASALKRGIRLNSGTDHTMIWNADFAKGARITASPTAGAYNILGPYRGIVAIDDKLGKLQRPLATPTTIIAYYAASVRGVTGHAKSFTFAPDHVVRDANGEYDPSTGTITSKQQQFLFCNVVLSFGNVAADNSDYSVSMLTTAGKYNMASGGGAGVLRDSGGSWGLNFASPIFPMLRGETARIEVQISGHASNNVSIIGGPASTRLTCAKTGATP